MAQKIEPAYFGSLIQSYMDMVDNSFEKIENEQQLLLAAKLGTLDKDDRRKQYPVKTKEQLIKALEELWIKHHACERQLKDRDKKIVEANERIDVCDAELKRKDGQIHDLLEDKKANVRLRRNQKWWNGILVTVILAAWSVIGFLAAHCAK